MSIRLEAIDPAGNSRFFESSLNIAASTRFGVERALWRSGKSIQSEFSRQVKAKNKTGRLYIRVSKNGARRKHIASAPGETPANRTGTYRKAFGFRVDGAHQLTVGNTADYSGFLEIGTSRMKARPGLGNAVRASERDIIRNLSTEIEAEI